MDRSVTNYIQKQKSPQKEVCTALRKIILETYPGIKEEMKWGVPVYNEGSFYIGAVKYGVNLGFSVNGLSEEQMKEFKGSGKFMRHIKITNGKEIDRMEITRLLKIVKKE